MAMYICPPLLADECLAASKGRRWPIGGVARPAVNQKPFLKLEEVNPLYVLPVTSSPLFPQLRGPRSPGVMRAGRQYGACMLIPRSLACLMVTNVGRVSLNSSQCSGIQCLSLSYFFFSVSRAGFLSVYWFPHPVGYSPLLSTKVSR